MFQFNSTESIVDANSFETQGPAFIIEPSHKLEFTNSAGRRADCSARGNPAPNVEWLDHDLNTVTSIPKVNIDSQILS